MQEPTPKSGSSLGKVAFIAILITLAAGGGYYFYTYQQTVSELTKPSGVGQGAPQQVEQKPLEEQIKEVEENKDIPAGMKQMVLGRLRGQLEAQNKEKEKAQPKAEEKK